MDEPTRPRSYWSSGQSCCMHMSSVYVLLEGKPVKAGSPGVVVVGNNEGFAVIFDLNCLFSLWGIFFFGGILNDDGIFFFSLSGFFWGILKNDDFFFSLYDRAILIVPHYGWAGWFILYLNDLDGRGSKSSCLFSSEVGSIVSIFSNKGILPVCPLIQFIME